MPAKCKQSPPSFSTAPPFFTAKTRGPTTATRMAPLLQSKAPATSLSSPILQSRLFISLYSLPRRRILTVQAKIREIFMPVLSSTMTEGKIVSWIKSESAVLSKCESVVVVVESDMDVETFYDGILVEGEVAPSAPPSIISRDRGQSHHRRVFSSLRSSAGGGALRSVTPACGSCCSCCA